MMRLYPDEGIGTVLMTNATVVKVAAMLDATDRRVLGTRYRWRSFRDPGPVAARRVPCP